jgi:ATP-dependent DNA ligase
MFFDIEPFEPARCDELPPENLSDPNYVGELKLDGSRYLLYIGFDPYRRNLTKHTLLSRRISTIDDKYVDRSLNVPHLTSIDYPQMDGTVLDGEIIAADFLATNSIMNSSPERSIEKQEKHGKLTFNVFDVLMLCGRDVRELPYQARRKILDDLIQRLNNPNIKLVPAIHGDLGKFFENVVSNGGEGIVVKNIHSPYGVGWAKVKKSFDVSCVISGFKEGRGKYSAGQIGSIALSVYQEGRLVEVGFASGFNEKLRREISANSDSFLGRVVDVFAQEMQSSRLRHPTFHRLRDDIDPSTCTLEKLKSDMTRNIKAGRIRE